MRNTTRMAGIGLLVYVIGTTAGFLGVGAPGGTYHPQDVAKYVSPDHFWTSFGFAYVGALSLLGLMVFGYAARALWPRVGDPIWALTTAATAVGITGGFVAAGVVVSAAEGGLPVQSGVPHPVVYMFGEIGNLLALCAPDFFMGVVAILLAVRAGLPKWLRVWSVIAGVCGILMPFYFTIPPYLLWALAFGTWLVVRGGRDRAAADRELHESLV